MYKLFLSLRYLRSRVIAYFAVLGVALCVAMMLIVVSVMNGFLDKIESAAKGLFSDIVIETGSLSGLGRYDELIAEVKRDVPQVQEASPFILTFGILSVPGTDHRQTVQIAGIRLPERAAVSDFENGLFVQKDWPAPTFDPPMAQMNKTLKEELERTEKIYDGKEKQAEGDNPSAEDVLAATIIGRAMIYQYDSKSTLRKAQDYQRQLSELQKQIDAARASKAEDAEIDALSEKLIQLQKKANFMGPENRIILGVDLPALFFRTMQGQTIRVITLGQKVTLSLIPLGRGLSITDISPNSATFTVVDDCRTGVSGIDSNIVYIPFETLQRLNNMEAKMLADNSGEAFSARCSQIHIKVKPEFESRRELIKVRQRIQNIVADYYQKHPDAASTEPDTMTWWEKQDKLLGSIANQRTLGVLIVGVVSVVAIVLILVIFYMIVVQKTKDIGIMKAVGASNTGVAQIFLAYGSAVGLVGSIIGVVGGYYFVRYINPIQDVIDYWFGYRVWSREWFMFEQIPNQVDWASAVVIVICSIIAGLIGAVIPAIRAGRMQPVEALRYE